MLRASGDGRHRGLMTEFTDSAAHTGPTKAQLRWGPIAQMGMLTKKIVSPRESHRVHKPHSKAGLMPSRSGRHKMNSKIFLETFLSYSALFVLQVFCLYITVSNYIFYGFCARMCLSVCVCMPFPSLLVVLFYSCLFICPFVFLKGTERRELEV